VTVFYFGGNPEHPIEGGYISSLGAESSTCLDQASAHRRGTLQTSGKLTLSDALPPSRKDRARIWTWFWSMADPSTCLRPCIHPFACQHYMTIHVISLSGNFSISSIQGGGTRAANTILPAYRRVSSFHTHCSRAQGSHWRPRNIRARITSSQTFRTQTCKLSVSNTCGAGIRHAGWAVAWHRNAPAERKIRRVHQMKVIVCQLRIGSSDLVAATS
jgi:hypothetical protein